MQIDYIKKRLITSMIAILLLVIALFGITYAYFTTRVKENISDKNVEVSAGKLELTYGDGNGIIKIDKIEPGDDIPEKTFTVENTGTHKIDHYEIILENLLNQLEYYKDLTYELTCSSNKKENCNGKTGVFPIYSNSITINEIEVEEIQTYTLKLYYKDTGVDQSADMKKNIYARINIRDNYKDYTKLNVYGNSNGLGTLITDENDKHYNKYKININVEPKNIFNVSNYSLQTINAKDYTKDSNIVKIRGNEGYGELAWSAGELRIIPSNILEKDKKYEVDIFLTLLEQGKYNNLFMMYLGDHANNARYRKTYYDSTLNKEQTVTLTFTPKVNVTVITLRLNNNYWMFDLNKLKINEIQYEMYLDEPLRCLNDKCDYIDFVNKKIVRNIVDENGTLKERQDILEQDIQVIDIGNIVDRIINISDDTNKASKVKIEYDK